MSRAGWRVVLWPLWAAGWLFGEAEAAFLAGRLRGLQRSTWERIVG